MIIRKSLLTKIGGYNENFDLAMDVDLFLSMMKFQPKIVIMEKAYVYQYDNGVSQRQWIKALRELRDIEIKHNRNKLAAYSGYFWRIFKSLLGKILRS